MAGAQPADARRRFLDSGSLIPPREINSDLSARTEKAIVWAMALHPDNRPRTIQEFSEALVGKGEVPILTTPSRPAAAAYSLIFGLQNQETLLAYAVAGLFLLGLIVTLAR